MGQALYRKYRSQNFDEIVGQEPITISLKNAIANDSISHAYLLTGPRGVGKTSIARIIAAEVNKIDYKEVTSHLDIIEIDAASNRRIDEIRSLRDKVHIAPALAKYKVYIIDEVHMLTREAFNALLKTLEEPPKHVIFILATTELHKLPATIISRTQRYNLKPISETNLIKQLSKIAGLEKIKINQAALELIAEHGSGSFRDSISLLDQARNMSTEITEKEVRTLLGIANIKSINNLEEAILQNDMADIVKILSELKDQSVSALWVAKDLSKIIRQKLISGSVSNNGAKVLKLLSDLLNVSSSENPYASLELILLSSVIDSVVADTPKNTVQSPKNASTPKIEEPLKTVLPQIELRTAVPSVPKEKSPVVSSNESLWQSVLGTVKTKHNTLYGILRMAKPEFNNNEITLNFGFAFHLKRIEDAKTRQLLVSLINELSGKDYTIKCVHSKSDAKTNQPNQSDAVKTISNIFGAAEVLD